VDHAKKGVMVICKTCEAVTRESICVAFLLLCVVNLKDGVRNTRLCNLCGIKDLC
jgi:hypothetical protein